MTFAIRPMTVADIPAAIDLWQAAEGIGLTVSDTPAALGAYLERNPGFSLVAADAAGSLLGVVLCGHDGARGYIRHLAVARPVRRLGIARALVERCLEKLRADQVHKCTIHLFRQNAAGRQVWDHLGWTARDDLTVMQVILTDPHAAGTE